MDRDVKQMVTKYIKPVEMIIKSNGKIGDKTTGPEIPDARQVLNIFYSKIINYGRSIIEVKRGKESIKINNDP
jgi:hypothetical protein